MNKAALEARGWRVLEVWECDLYAREKRERTLDALVQALRRDA
jgi:G:T-mismatch repair DNA endonuclease (very short patch repair protein)